MEKQEELKGKWVTPIGKFNCQTYPLVKDNIYFLTEEEEQALANHTKCWSSEEYEADIPVYEEKENEEGLIEKIEVCTEKVTKTRPILIDNDPTEENNKEAALKRIAELKRLLSESDYKAIKYAEGFISKTDYAETKALRQSYRDEINELEKTI